LQVFPYAFFSFSLKIQHSSCNGLADSIKSGYIQPAKWAYKNNIVTHVGWANDWEEIWKDSVDVPQDSVVIISISGHIRGSSGCAALGAMIDGKSVHPNISDFYGAVHTYNTVWDSIGYSIFVDVPAGKHTFGVGVKSVNGNVEVNGTRLYYTIIPKLVKWNKK